MSIGYARGLIERDAVDRGRAGAANGQALDHEQNRTVPPSGIGR